jgi:hypothetical protein
MRFLNETSLQEHIFNDDIKVKKYKNSYLFLGTSKACNMYLEDHMDLYKVGDFIQAHRYKTKTLHLLGDFSSFVWKLILCAFLKQTLT